MRPSCRRSWPDFTRSAWCAVSSARCRSTRPPDIEIDFRLRQKEREFQQALIAASGIRVEALADDGVVVPGQEVNVSLVVANRGATEVAVKQVKFDGFADDARVHADAGHRSGFRRRGGRGGRGRAADAPPPIPVFGAQEGCRRPLRRQADDSRRRPHHANRTGIVRARRAATRSTTTRRSVCRSGRRRSMRR